MTEPTPQAEAALQELKNQLRTPRSLVKWCYDHGKIAGKFPDSAEKVENVLDMAQYIIESQIIPTATTAALKDLAKQIKQLAWDVDRQSSRLSEKSREALLAIDNLCDEILTKPE